MVHHAAKPTVTIQLAVFSDHKNAQALVEKLRQRHFIAYTKHVIHNHHPMTAVFVGPEANRHQAFATQQKLRNEFRLNGEIKKYPS